MTHHRQINLLLLIGIVLLTGAALFGTVRGVKQDVLIPVSDITSENGFTYTTALPASRYWLLDSLSDTIGNPGQSKTQLFENDQLLGPAHSLHETIRSAGRGRFSHWGSNLYFSTSDNSDPRTNGRIYKVVITATSPTWVLGVLSICLLISLYFNRRLFFSPYSIPGLTWVVKEVLPGVLITLILLTVLAAAGELIFRLKWPFNKITWPTRFDSSYGWTFLPGSTINWTNYVDFWASNQANSLGFLDREPPSIKHPGDCRVIFLGDSYVEAAQLTIDKKFHVLFEEMANAQITPGQKFESVAFGYSGTGQANQLPFYDIFAKPLQPNVVILVFVANDLANNSTVLESVRNGWDPRHPPRLYFEYKKSSAAFKPIPIDPNWQSFLLPSFPVENPPPEAITWLKNESYLYNWLYAGFLSNSQIPAVQQFASWANGSPPSADIYRYRRKELEKLPGFADVFKDWNPENMNIDGMFDTEKLPPIFEEAVMLTGHTFDEFLERSHRDRFQLLVFITDSIQYFSKRQFDLITKLLIERQIAYISQYDYIIANGGNPAKGRYPHDGHWNEQGHQWAAQALLEYFQTHPQICK